MEADSNFRIFRAVFLFVDQHGTLHRQGTMRLATARDEIEPLRDPRVRENDAYLTIIVLSRPSVKRLFGVQ